MQNRSQSVVYLFKGQKKETRIIYSIMRESVNRLIVDYITCSASQYNEADNPIETGNVRSQANAIFLIVLD